MNDPFLAQADRAGVVLPLDERNLLSPAILCNTMKMGMVTVEDTDENRQICMKYCGICPNYKKNCLGSHQPDNLFCARGRSNAAQIREQRCFCLACEIFAKNSLALGHFCEREK